MKLKIIAGILAYVATFGIERMIWRAGGDFTLPNSIFSIFIWLAIWKLFLAVSKLMNRRALICSLILGGIFSTFMVFGVNLFANDSTEIDKLKTFTTILAGMPFFSAVIIWIFNFIENFKAEPVTEKICAKKYFLISWAIIFVAWLPALLAQFPGIAGYDSLLQIDWYRQKIILPIHPPIHTVLLGFCVVTLGKFFGSYEFGFLIYTLIQMLLVSAIFAAILTYMLKKNIPKTFRIGWTIFFMFCPLNPIMAMSATKDIIFAVLLGTLVLTFFVSLEKTPKHFLPLAIFFSFMFIIFRNQGLYVFAFGMIFGLLLMKRWRVQLLKIFSAAILLNFVYTNIFLESIGDQQNRINYLRKMIGTQIIDANNLSAERIAEFSANTMERMQAVCEMLGVPIVQLSRVGTYHKDELSAEEILQIKKYIPDFEIYNVPGARGSSDPPRGRFQYPLVYENPKEFLKMYIKYARKYPLDYFDAFCRLTCAQWYPDLFFHKNYDGQPYFQYESFQRDAEGYVTFVNSFYEVRRNIVDSEVIIPENHSVFGFKWLHDFYFKLTYKYSYERIPIVSMLFSTGFTFWLILIFAFYFLYRKDYRALFPTSFIIGLWLTMILGPMALLRYTFPLMVTIPILFTYAFGVKRNFENKNNHRNFGVRCHIWN